MALPLKLISAVAVGVTESPARFRAPPHRCEARSAPTDGTADTTGGASHLPSVVTVTASCA